MPRTESNPQLAGLSRRELLAAGIAAGASLVALDAAAAGGLQPRRGEVFDFAGRGWKPGWETVGVANLKQSGGEALLEAGSDVFPNDPRPVAFLPDTRFLSGAITATVTRTGAAPGVLLRRRSPSNYYAAIYDSERLALLIVRRIGTALDSLALTPVPIAIPPVTLSLDASGATPTELRATLSDATGLTYRASARDATTELQRPGDPGVLASARTLFPSASNPVLPALGNLHLLPYGVQEGQAVLETPVGEVVIGAIRERSTVAFSGVGISFAGRAHKTAPSIVAATTGPPINGGARLHVATDLPARVSIDVSLSPGFSRARRVRAGETDRFHAVTRGTAGLPRGRRVYWRARASRRGLESVGPVRSFRVPPARGAPSDVTLAVCSCASQFGAIFDRLAEARPDVLVWHGDLNYPDTHGPLAQTLSGYAGIWRDFLANPRMAPILERTAFAAQRDDHDYGIQDANAGNIPEFAGAPWDSLMGDRLYYRFAAGPVEVWVLDQRRFKSDPGAPDNRRKTLLGERQRRWLLRTLAASPAAFKLVCSPCTVFMPGNGRDGGWSEGFGAERRLLLAHIGRRVAGRVLFLTGDTHLTGVFEGDAGFEARAAPLDIPTPNDVTLVNPNAAAELRGTPGIAYASDQGHFTLIKARSRERHATLELTLVGQDGKVRYRRLFESSSLAA